ncbi:Tripartite motif-containing protein 2, variant 2 [Chamberlinius hualienensis]
MDLMEDHRLVSLSDLALNGTEPATQLLCPNHTGQILDFYCRDCETAVCSICTELEHHEHLNLQLQEAIEEQKEELRELLDKVYSQVPMLKEAIEVVTDLSVDVAGRKAESEEKINSCFQKLMLKLKQRQVALLTELEEIHNQKQETLSKQKEMLESCLANLSSSCEFTEKALSRGNDTQVLLVRKQMEEMLAQYSQLQIQRLPEENNHIEFNAGEVNMAIKCLSSIGAIESNSAIAYESTASGEGLRHCITGKQTVVSITTKDRRGELVKVGHSILHSELKCVSTGALLMPSIVDHKNGTYDLVYSTPKEGHYQLTILLFGQHIKGSPFHVRSYAEEETSSSDRPISKIPRTTGVKQRATKRTPSAKSASSCNRRSNPIEDDLVMRVGCKGRNKGEFTNPQGICYSSASARIIVTDSNNQCIQVFNEQGECKLRFGIRGRSAGQVQRPTGVTCLANGNTVIADYDNKWVSVFEPCGKFVSRVGVGKLLGPKGLAVDRNGNLIVVDNKASTILVFEPNGKLIHKFGSRGNGDQQFAGPHFVCVDSRNRMAITDFHNHCVKIFDCEGQFLSRFGSNGEGNGQFNAPTGIAFDQQENLIVADWGNSRIQVFDSNGSFLSYVNTMADPLYGPQGLAVTDDGHIVVADSGNHCFKMYKYLQ